MIQFRERTQRGHTQLGWLDSHHTFSFGDYHDANFMGFRQLRVINDDRVIPGAGFNSHSHRDMEIVSYVLSGALSHRDSLGTTSVIRPGEVQRMSAGTGITHSEFNHSQSEPVHFLQIWILPKQTGLKPSYEQKEFPREQSRNRFLLVADSEGANGAVRIHQDVRMYAADLEAHQSLEFSFAPQRFGWLQVALGTITLAGRELREGDGVQFSGASGFSATSATGAELLLFELD